MFDDYGIEESKAEAAMYSEATAAKMAALEAGATEEESSKAFLTIADAYYDSLYGIK